MFRSLFILISALIMGISSAGLVFADRGFYIGGRGDVSFLNSADTKGPSGNYPTPLDLTADTKTGFAVRGAVGYAFHNNFRLEGEVGYRRNGLDSINVRSAGGFVETAAPVVAAEVNRRAGQVVYSDPANTTYADLFPTHKAVADQQALGTHDIDGNAEAITLLANAYYDFHFASGLKPYIGGGLGVAFLSADVESTLTGTTLLDDSDTVFAYQLFAGVGYEIHVADRPVTLLLDYSYFSSQNPSFTGNTSGNTFETEFTGHYVGLGALVFFGD